MDKFTLTLVRIGMTLAILWFAFLFVEKYLVFTYRLIGENQALSQQLKQYQGAKGP